MLSYVLFLAFKAKIAQNQIELRISHLRNARLK